MMIFFRIKHNFQSKEGIPINKLSLIISCIIIIFTAVFPESQLNIHTPIAYNESSTLIQEGFVAGTLVKTPQGYTPIEQLQVGDTIIGYDEHIGPTGRTVLNVFRHHVQSYIRLYLDNVFYEIGSHQKLYNHENNTWVQVNQLKPGNRLGSNLYVIQVELIQEQIDLYAITVEHHTFCITKKDILVHNIEPISSGCAITAIVATGAIANPVGATIAGTIMTAVATTAFIYKLWQTLVVKKPKNKTFSHRKVTTPSIAPQERNSPIYYADNQEGNGQSPASQNPESNGSGGGIPPEDPEDNNEKKDKEEIKFPENESMLKHIFRPSRGHFPLDSPENRNHLLNLVKEKRNFIGICDRGQEWYVKILENGKQLWVVVRNNIIRNGGINETPRTFNSITGLSRLLPGK